MNGAGPELVSQRLENGVAASAVIPRSLIYREISIRCGFSANQFTLAIALRT